jgi:hypothetical protein
MGHGGGGGGGGGDGANAGSNGWNPTGRKGAPRRERKDGAPSGDGFKSFMKQQMGGRFADMQMDDQYTGVKKKAKKGKSKKVVTGGDAARTRAADGKPEFHDDGREVGDVDSQKCLMQAAKICPMRVMMENFAAFNLCVFDHREQMTGHCEGWAEQHGGCLEDMKAHCFGKSPPETTRCMMEKQKALSRECRGSATFESLSEGFEQMNKKAPEGGDDNMGGGMPSFGGDGAGGMGGMDFGGMDFDKDMMANMGDMGGMPDFGDMGGMGGSSQGMGNMGGMGGIDAPGGDEL